MMTCGQVTNTTEGLSSDLPDSNLQVITASSASFEVHLSARISDQC